MSYIHLKLDKIAAGDQKRLFKSSAQLYEKQNIIQNNTTIQNHIQPSNNIKINQVFYGNFSKDMRAGATTQYENTLLNFNSVQQQYITKKDNINIKQYISASKYYNTLLQQNQYNGDQMIQYYKSIMEIPIDISSVQNMVYMLSPLGTRKNIQMCAPQFNINTKNISISADYKPNYGQLVNYILGKSVQCPQKETIPIYDLNLTDIETITFQTEQKLTKWIKKYKFDTIYYNNMLVQQYILCNINNKFSQYDSVNLSRLFQVLQQQKFNIFYTVAVKKQLMKDLIDNLNQQSMNCRLSSIGVISKLSNATKSLYINNQNLLQTINQHTDIAIKNITKQETDFYTTNTIPHNSLYMLSLTKPLEYQNVDFKPSAYFNFVNLRNMQTPLQDYQVYIPQPHQNSSEQIKQFNIYGNKKDYELSSLFDHVYNKDTVKLYDIDRTKSLQFNDIATKVDSIEYSKHISHAIPNMYVTSSILENSIKYDQQYRADINLSASYISIDSNTLRSKVDNYFLPFYERHIQDNKEYEIGQLYGLRSYIKTGILDDQQNIWLTYKYVTSNSNELNNSYNLTYNLPFKLYQLDRFNKYMLKNESGILYNIQNNIHVIKQSGNDCPYQYINNLKNGCSGFICSATKDTKCNGYCVFPVSQNYFKLNTPSGTYWSNNQHDEYSTTQNLIKNNFSKINDNWFYFMPSAEIDYKQAKFDIYAQTDIFVTDDIEIYFSNLSFNDFVQYIQENGPFYDSIYGGFGHENDIDYSDFLLRNNSEIKRKQKYEVKNISAYMDSLQSYIKKYMLINQKTTLSALFDKPLYYFIDKSYLEHIQNFQYYKRLFDKRLIEFFNISANIDLYNILTIQFSYLLDGSEYMVGYKEQIIPANTSYYNFYTQNFYKYIKQLVLDENTELKIKDMPLVNIVTDTLLLYNNFVIPFNTPFNGPHKIAANTKLVGLVIRQDGDIQHKQIIIHGKRDFLKSDEFCYIRVINWWSNQVKCQGKIKIKPQTQSYKESPQYAAILNTINSYDHVELVDGFFKSAQRDYKKSNIYSIKITNSGLNPINDKSIADFHECLLIRNYAYLKDQYKQYYYFINMQEFDKIQIDNFNNWHNGNITLIQKLYNTNLDNQIDIVKDYQKYYINDREEQKLTLQKYRDSKCYQYINGQGGIYILDIAKLSKAIKTRRQLRTIFEDAIKDSVKKYMPLHTDLWKIIYSEK